MTDREPVGQAVNSMRSRVLDIAKMVNCPQTYDEVLVEEGELYALWNDLGWIVMYIRKREEEKRKQKFAPRIRIVR